MNNIKTKDDLLRFIPCYVHSVFKEKDLKILDEAAKAYAIQYEKSINKRRKINERQDDYI